jgi:hypothetical protein
MPLFPGRGGEIPGRSGARAALTLNFDGAALGQRRGAAIFLRGAAQIIAPEYRGTGVMSGTRISPHKMNTLTEAEKEKIVDLYRRHDVSTRALATRFSVHPSTILATLRDAGVTVKGGSGASRK